MTCDSNNFGVAPEISEAMCINRLLDGQLLNEIPDEFSISIKKLVKETFYLGVFTQLYLMNFPTRDNFENVNRTQLRRKWQIDAITSDVEMGYYGDPENPILMDLWEYHYYTKVVPKFREKLNPTSFKFGKFKSYFQNLYLSGALLVMYCDLSTKGTLD